MTLAVVGILVLMMLTPAAQAATNFRFETTNATANESHFMKAFDAPSSAVADFNNDGKLELVAHNDNQYVYVLGSASPYVLAEFRPDYPPGWNVRPLSAPVVADVDADGQLDVVVVTSAASVCVFEHKGSFRFEKQWCTRMDRFEDNPGADAGAAVADVNGDGDLEIFSNTEDKGLYAFNPDGSVRWALDRYGGNAGPLAVDIDKDGTLEIIWASDGGTITAADGDTGRVEWTFHAGSHVWPASVTLSGNVGDIDGDGKGEYVFIARHAEHTDDYQKNDFMMFALEHDGRLKWKVQPPWGNPLSYTHPILYDIDGDGRDEIFTQDWNTIGHKPGNWERLGKANVFAYRGDGSLMWRTEIDNTWSNDDLGLADMDGDGKLEIVAVGPDTRSGYEDGVWYLDARTGAKETHVRSGGWTVLRGPVIADFDGDGKVGMALSVHDSEDGGGFRFYETDSACWVVFGGWTVDDPCSGGSKPGSGGTDGGTGGDSGGTFDADFTVKGSNEWWIQVDVDPDSNIRSVEVSLNGGSWKPLEKKSWGDWAASYHAPEGTIVQFRATSHGGATDTSGCYRWTSGSATTCGGTGGDTGGDAGGTFDAHFTVKGSNEWWIQVDVDPDSSIRSVDVSINGGSWRPLEKKSWGDWAASYHAPEGSQVQFRATSHGGATDTSGCYRWTSGSPMTCGSTGGGSTFDAHFTPRNGNEWWIQVKVEANQDLSRVDVRINDGSWKPLEKKSWGDWAASYHAPSGSKVEFRATSTSGATDTSSAYTWPVS